MISELGKEGGACPRGRHTEAEIIGALKQVEAGRKAEDVAREVGVLGGLITVIFQLVISHFSKK